ncbi:MAG: hypothetical protein ACREQ8_11760 [Woeseiaceae bacterium]
MAIRGISERPSPATYRRRTLEVTVERLALKAPFRISGYTFTDLPVLRVRLHERAASGRGEAAGVYYLHDTPERMQTEVEAVRDAIEAGAARTELGTLLAAGGARNALDCALWELEARRAGVSVWQLAGIDAPGPLITTAWTARSRLRPTKARRDWRRSRASRGASTS